MTAAGRVGPGGLLSPGATRLACLAAASRSFDVASGRLAELAGVRIDDEAIRRHRHRAAAAAGRRREVAAPRAAFAAAEGEVEFLTDGVMAPSRDGWREVKVGLFQVRPRGKPAGPGEWADRELPPPTASAADATTADCDAFAATWRARAEAPGIDPDGPLTALADGAAWTWRAAGERFAAAEVPDISHASQHLAAAAKAPLGEGTPGAAEWLERGRARLLAGGWPGLRGHAGETTAGGMTDAGRAAADGPLGYFAGHTGRVGYLGRLRAGRPIGGGAVEGLARRLGRRLKVPGRGWHAENIEGMATLIATAGTAEWAGLWSRPAAWRPRSRPTPFDNGCANGFWRIPWRSAILGPPPITEVPLGRAGYLGRDAAATHARRAGPRLRQGVGAVGRRRPRRPGARPLRVRRPHLRP